MNALLLASLLALGAEPAPQSTFVGEVVPLSELLAKRKIPHDPSSTLVLVMNDGKFLPLVKSPESRLFYLDKRLLNRPMQLTGALVPGSEMLQVTDVHSLKDGVLHEVYYWCEKCKLRAAHAGPCICCGAETELWEEPIKSKK